MSIYRHCERRTWTQSSWDLYIQGRHHSSSTIYHTCMMVSQIYPCGDSGVFHSAQHNRKALLQAVVLYALLCALCFTCPRCCWLANSCLSQHSSSTESTEGTVSYDATAFPTPKELLDRVTRRQDELGHELPTMRTVLQYVHI